jgi:hypothetical protein
MDDTAHEPESQRSTASRGSRRRRPRPATGLLYAYDIDAPEREPRHVGTGHGRGALAVADDEGRRARCPATSGGAVWALRDSGELIQVEPNTGGIALQCRAGRGARQLAVGADAIWVVTARGRSLARLDPTSGQLDQETAWVVCRQRRHAGNGALAAVDRRTGELRETVALSGQPRAIAIGAGAIWVGCSHHGSKHRGTIQRFTSAISAGSATVAEG